MAEKLESHSGEQCRIIIPGELQKQLGLKIGDKISFYSDNGEIILMLSENNQGQKPE